MIRKNLTQLFGLGLALALALTASAQSPGTGTITGHVFNTVNQQYVRDADVHVEGTNLTVPTEAGGAFTLARVPAGAVRVTVTYAGLATATVDLELKADETLTREIELQGAAVVTKDNENDAKTLKLETVVVSAARDGNAKALQRQKNSMNLSRSVSSDAFGNVTEGNVGEFLKYLPGISLEYSEADTRGPRIGGMSSEYASVTLDGKSIASADAFNQYVGYENSGAGTVNRSFGFDTISINSIDSIEVNRVLSAAMSADAPSGNINLKVKKAFDLKERQIRWDVGTIFNTDEFTLKKTVGPNDAKGRKFRPNYSLNYSDVFLNNKLGVVFSVQESNVYVEQYNEAFTYNRVKTATDQRGQVLTGVTVKDGPKWTERGSYTGTFDYRATPNLTLSLSTLFARYHAEFYNRQVTMNAGGTRDTVTGDGVLTYGTATTTGGNVAFGGGNGQKFTNTLTLAPSFEYRHDNITIDGAFTSSHSRNDYDNLAHGTVANTPVNNLTGIGFTASRSSLDGGDWTFVQTGGPDWTNLAAQSNPRISDDTRQNTIDLKSGEANIKYVLPTKLPTFLQAGVKVTRNHQIAADTRQVENYLFIGPGGGLTGNFAAYPTPFALFGGKNQPGVTFRSINGGGAPAFPDRDELGELFQTHPEFFTRAEGVGPVTVANYENGRYTNNPTYDVVESIDAGYLMANTRIAKLQLQGGVRFEKTSEDSLELDPRSNQEVLAAGYPGVAGAPSTYAGIDYKYSKPKVHRKSDYHDYFPSLTAKYTFAPNLLGDIGWGKTIRRPDISKITGVRSINDDAEIITTPNPNLKPERSEKIAASLSYFFGQASTNNFQVVASHNRVTNQTTGASLTSQQYGNTDPQYDTYMFTSFSNIQTPVTYNSLEYSYQQYLLFLPRVLQGTSVNLSYTRSYYKSSPTAPNGGRLWGIEPHSVKGTLAWRYGRFAFSASGIWVADTNWQFGTTDSYQKANLKVDVSGTIKITDRLGFYFAGRNIFQTPHQVMQFSAGNPDVVRTWQNYGTNWSFGIRGTF